MQAPLPVASYLFILRKHMWLVLGTVAAVLAGGWFYARSVVPVYRAVALVQILPRAASPAGAPGLVLQEVPTFVSDQVYRVRTDVDLARKVLDDLRAPLPPAAAGGGRDDGPSEPPRPDPARFEGVAPGSLPGMISVTAVPGTSYYQFAAQGPDRDVIYSVANSYAKVFSRDFSEQRARQYLGPIRDYESKRDDRKRKIDDRNGEIATLKKGNPQVDFDRGEGDADRENASALRKILSEERVNLISLEAQVKAVRQTLAAVDLRLEDRGPEGFGVLPPHEGAPADDPRLSERVQTLDVVARHEGVRKALAGIEAAEAEDRVLAKTLQPDFETRRIVRERIDAHLKSQARSTEAALVKVAQDLDRSKAVVQSLRDDITTLEGRIAATSGALADHERLRKSVEGLQAEVAGLTEQILEAERQRKKMGDEGGGTVSTYQYAQPGAAALVAPNRPVIYITTIVAALLLAAALAYVLEYLDDTVKTREDFDRLVRLPFLGYVPHLPEPKDGGSRDLIVSRGKTGTPEVESFRAIRTGIQFCRPDREIRTLLVTSAGPGEGKTTLSVNLASAFTGSRGRVLLIDADLRRARVHSALGVDNARGLTNVLVGEAALGDVVQRASVEGLDVLASGPIPPNPAEVLGSERMQELLREAAAKYERVVVDSPPLVAVTDPALLAKYVDAVFLVISIGKTSIRTIQRARETLASVGVDVHGAILNNADEKISGYSYAYGGYGYRYGYGYGYTPRPAEPGAK